jgi:hypothetical protein
MKCCPVGTVYDGNGNCVVVCGTDSSGNAFACDVDQSCLEIDGLNPNQIAELEKEYGSKVRINNNSAFICKSNNLSCQYGNESSLPPSIDNYYPCLPLPSSDSSVAYCTSDDQTKISTCFNSHNNESTCVKDPNCTWRDVMKYVSSNLDINGSIQKIQTDMNVIQGKSGGYYCDSTQDKTSYSRVIAYPSSGCDWDSCWSRLAQPSIIGVRYNADTGNCIAMQSCNNPSAGMNSWSTSAGGSNPGQRVPNPDKVNIFGNNNSSFPACQGSSCPIPSSDTAFKCGTNGKIYSGCDKCTNQQTCVDSDTCDCSQAGMYGKNCDVRVGTLQYSDDQGNLYLNYDMAYPANANVNFETTSNSKWYFKQDGTNSLRNFDQTSYPAIGANTQNWYGGSQNVFSYNSLCLGNSSGNCSEIKTLYSSTGKIPDSDNILKSDSTSIPGGQCNGVCYPNLITYRGEDGIVSAWSSPRYPCSEYGSPCWDTPANSYIEGTPVTWVDMSLSPDEKQRAMQL